MTEPTLSLPKAQDQFAGCRFDVLYAALLLYYPYSDRFCSEKSGFSETNTSQFKILY